MNDSANKGEYTKPPVPLNLLKEERGTKRLFTVVPGLNRNARKEIVKFFARGTVAHLKPSSKRQAHDDIVISALLNYRRRPHRFWNVWLPAIAGTKANKRRAPLIPSVDYFLLEQYAAGFVHRAADQEQLNALIPDLTEIEIRTIEAIRFTEDYDGKTLPLQPFTLWLDMRRDLERWSELDEDERDRLVNAIYALDSITAGGTFFHEAKLISPSCEAYFSEREHDDAEESEAAPEVAETDQPEGNSLENDLQFQWINLWSGIADVAERAKSGPPKRSMITELRDWLDSVNQIEGLIPDVAEWQAELAGLRDKLCELLEQVATLCDFGWLAHGKTDEIMSVWEGMEADASTIEDCRRACNDVIALSKEAQHHTKNLQELRATAAAAKEASKLLSPGERRSNMESDRALQERIAKLEDDIAALEESIAEAAKPKSQFSNPTAGESTTEQSEVEIDAESVRTVIAPAAPEEQLKTTEAAIVGRPDVLASDATKTPQKPIADVVKERVDSPSVRATPSPSSSATQPTSDLLLTKFSPAAGARCRPIWQAIEAGRLSEAYFIARALAQLDPELTIPSADLIKACRLAAEVRTGHGPISRELQLIYAGLDRTLFEEGPDEWRLAMSLLLIAATLRPAVIAPGTGATGVLHYGHPTGQLHSLRKLVIQHSDRLQGLSLDPTAFRTLFNVTNWDDEMARLKEDIAEWISQAPSRSMKFQAATAVWKRLQGPTGKLGGLLNELISDKPPNVSDVTSRLAELSDPSKFEALIRKIDRQELGRPLGDDIHARAFDQLRDSAEDAFDLIGSWISLMQSRPERKDYLVKQLEDLRRGLEQIEQHVDTELERLVADDTNPYRLVAAAVSVLRSAIAGLHRIFDPKTFTPEDEVQPEVLLGLPLLAARELDLDAQWIPMQQPQDQLSALERLISEATIDWGQAFLKRCEDGDLDGAARIQRYVDAPDASTAILFDKVYREQRELHRARLKTMLQEARSNLEKSFAFGYIQNEFERSIFDGRLVTVENDFELLLNYRSAMRAVAAVIQDLKLRQEQRLAEVRLELDKVDVDESSPEYLRLLEVISKGDLVTANEYLQGIREGRSLPSDGDAKHDLFADYFPTVVKELESHLQGPNGSTSEVLDAVKRGKQLGPLSLENVGKTQLASGADMLRAWYALKRSERADVDNLGIFFRSLGFDSVKIRVGQGTQGRTEIELDVTALHDRFVCPVPLFGSQAAGKYRVVCIWKRPTDEDLLRQIGDVRAGRPTIVMYFGRLLDKQRRDIARKCREVGKTFLLADEVLVVYLCSVLGSRLASFFACTLPFTLLEPFVTTSGQVPPEMFYGRQSELRRVTDNHGACFVYGGRQLGKTALLREAQRSFNSPNQRRFALFIDLRVEGIGYAREPSEIWTLLYRELKAVLPVNADQELAEPIPGRKGSIDLFIDSMCRYFSVTNERRLLLLLDEADRFLEQDSRGYGQSEYSADFVETARLRGLMDETQRMIKVVFAGLHNVVRTTEQANHPLAHFGDPIEIGPLVGTNEWQEARNLIRVPLLAAGYEFQTESLVDRILAQTNYYPSLIQLYCAQLIRQLHSGRNIDRNGPRYAITDQIVDDAYQSRELREAISSRFHLTLQLDLRYELLAYVVAYGILTKTISFPQGATLKYLRDEPRSWWSEGFAGTSDQEFKIILEEMIGLGIFRHAEEEGHYSLRNPNILRLLGPIEEIERRLVRERELPQEFEPDIFHALNPKDASSPSRCPLSFSQERSLQRKSNGVSVVVGSDLCGLADLELFLKRRIPPDFLVGGSDTITDRTAFNRALENLETRHRGGTTVLIVPDSVAWNGEWIRQAMHRLGGLRATDKQVRVVFIADPPALEQLVEELEDLASTGLEIVPLRPWRERFLRQWLDDIGISDPSPGARAKLTGLTGLWSAILVTGAQKARDAHSVNQLSETIESELADQTYRSQIIKSLGTPNGGGRFLKFLSDLGGEATEDDMKEFCSDYGIDGGFIHHWVQWGALLHFIVEAGRGYWRLDRFVTSLLKD